jgi:transcriptional regulator with XRE-family HTH domain
MLDPNERLRKARIAAKKSEQEVAAAAGLSLETYYDLESNSQDPCISISLDELLKVAKSLELHPIDIVGDMVPHEVEVTCRIDFQEFREIIQDFLNRRKLTVAELEEIAGWELSDFMNDPETAWSWNSDALRFVAGACGIHWLAVLPYD